MNKIHATRSHQNLRIYINDLIHIDLPIKEHNGLQSWLEGSDRRRYFIQFYRKIGEPIILEYEDRNIWEEILKVIDKNL